MELLTTAGLSVVPRGRTLRLALGVSAAAHALLAAGVVELPARAYIRDAPIEVTVDVVADAEASPQAPPPPAPPSAGAATRPPEEPRPRHRHRLPSPALASEPERPAASPVPPRSEDAPSQKMPPPAAVAADVPANVPTVAEGKTVGPVGPVGSAAVPSGMGVLAGDSRPAGAGSGAPSGGVQRRAAVDRYRSEVLGARIREVFRYPTEARDLELAGRVLLNVSIGRDGRLLDVRLAGRCPHAILCADGLRTIRAAAPFPPIPAELGPSILVEVPLTYAFALE